MTRVTTADPSDAARQATATTTSEGATPTAAPSTVGQAKAGGESAGPKVPAFAGDVFDPKQKWGIEAQKSVDLRTCAPLTIAGREIPRIAPPPTRPTGIGGVLCDLILGNALNPLINHFAVIEPSDDFRGEAAVAQAVREPLPGGIEKGDQPFGELAILRPGLGNLVPSPSMVYRTAMMSGRVVLAYSNMTDPTTRTLRAVTELEGVPVPREMRGKVFAIGSPSNNLISFPQASDVMIEQLQILHDRREELGVDVFDAGATMIAHSQGGLESVVTRRRLEQAGLPHVIGRLVAIGSPFRGANMADRLIGLASGVAAALVDIDDGMDAVRMLDPDRTRQYIGDADQKYVELSIYGEIKGPPRFGLRWGIPPFEIREQSPVRPSLRLASSLGDIGAFRVTAKGLFDALRFASEDDGLVSSRSARFGKEQVELDAAHDHLGVWESWKVIDEAAARLAAMDAAQSERRASA